MSETVYPGVVLAPGETLEVLPPSPQTLIKCRHYVVRLRRDTGNRLVVAQAPDHRAAISKVLAAAGATRQAVISVQKIRVKD